jgi:hypothetical protein
MGRVYDELNALVRVERFIAQDPFYELDPELSNRERALVQLAIRAVTAPHLFSPIHATGSAGADVKCPRCNGTTWRIPDRMRVMCVSCDYVLVEDLGMIYLGYGQREDNGDEFLATALGFLHVRSRQEEERP